MSDDKIVRVLRVLEYVGPRDRLYSDLDKRHVNHTYTTTTLAGGGYIKEVLLAEVNDLAGFPLQIADSVSTDQSEAKESEKKIMHLYSFASVGQENVKIEGTSPEEAWTNYYKSQRSSLSNLYFKLLDPIRNDYAVTHEGYTKLYSDTEKSPVYKQIF